MINQSYTRNAPFSRYPGTIMFPGLRLLGAWYPGMVYPSPSGSAKSIMPDLSGNGFHARQVGVDADTSRIIDATEGPVLSCVGASSTYWQVRESDTQSADHILFRKRALSVTFLARIYTASGGSASNRLIGHNDTHWSFGYDYAVGGFRWYLGGLNVQFWGPAPTYLNTWRTIGVRAKQVTGVSRLIQFALDNAGRTGSAMKQSSSATPAGNLFHTGTSTGRFCLGGSVSSAQFMGRISWILMFEGFLSDAQMSYVNANPYGFSGHRLLPASLATYTRNFAGGGSIPNPVNYRGRIIGSE